MSENELAKFDALKADIQIFVAPVLKVQVLDFKSSQDAIDAGKTIKKYMKDLEAKKKELTAPLDAQIKMIRSYAKSIEEPLFAAEQHLKAQLALFAAAQEKIRQAELRRIEEERREAERKAEEERQKREDELEAKRQAELEELQQEQERKAKAAAMFGGEAETVDMEAEAAAIDEKIERERLEAEAKAERERMQRVVEESQAKYDAKQFQIQNARKTWDFEVTDVNQIPKEYLIITVNKQMILAAIRAGVKIPGVKAFQKIGVAFGANTRVSQVALESEEEHA
jgi:hypothetical protein